MSLRAGYLPRPQARITADKPGSRAYLSILSIPSIPSVPSVPSVPRHLTEGFLTYRHLFFQGFPLTSGSLTPAPSLSVPAPLI
ncbi:hypothetical protein, partial [Pantoea ananatis]|uniref:hypothetical protein n=1 Tax=Pantoea ananas TaxID=553 RepID=UPI0023AFF154